LHSFALVELLDRPAANGGTSTEDEQRSARVIHRRNGVGIPNHDVLEAGELLFYNDTNANQLVALDRTRTEVSRVTLPGAPGFARGLAWLGGDLFLAGNESPASVHTVDMRGGRVVSSLSLEGPPKETVFAIAVLSGSFSAPPSLLPGFEPEPSLVSP
jgi:hypothetical protein